MKEQKIIPGTNIEASRNIIGGKTETLTGAILYSDDNALDIKLCKRVILNKNKKDYDLVEITSSVMKISWKEIKSFIVLNKAPDLAVVGWDDSGY